MVTCIILAAGYATRLYPLTENFPKPLLPVGGKPILDRLLDDLSACGGIRTYIVVTNHRFAAHFTAWAAGRTEHIEVADDGTVSNETRLGAVADMRFAMDRYGVTDDVLVIAGDNLLDFSLGRFLSYAKEKRASAVLRYYEENTEKLKKCGVMRIGEDDRILSMEEKPPVPASHWCCPPFYYYTAADARRIGEGIAAGCGTDAPGSFAAWLSGQVPVYAMRMPGKRYDIGNLQSYEDVQKNYKGVTIC